ncbi:MAG: SRPBCC family protein [Thainema sp.]
MTATADPTAQALAEQSNVLQPEQLQHGKVAIAQQHNHYQAQVLADASADTAWVVLNDFESLSNFLPTVVSSRILDDRGNQKIVEQVDRRQILMMNVDSTIRTQNLAKPDERRIDFRLIDGDLKKMSGYWQVDAVATETAEQALITQVVEADAEAGLFDGMFQKIFADSLQENMLAIKAEIERRS